MKAFRFIPIFMLIFVLASATVSFASEDRTAPAAGVKDLNPSSGESSESVITGIIQKYEPQKKIKPQAYQIVNEKKESFKIIGPKSITDLITAIPEFEKLTFKFIGKIIKKENKKGILISKFEVCAPQQSGPQTPAPATSEVETKK